MATFGAGTKAQEVIAGKRYDGKRAIVTGATSGLGIETARVLASAGMNVVMAVRDTKRGEKTAPELQAGLDKDAGVLTVAELDLADLASVRRFVDRTKAKGEAISYLMCNAGIMGVPQGKTPQGFELQVGTNHLGHFALVTGLLPLLQAPARIVLVSSALHTRGKGERLIAALEKKEQKYVPMDAYGDSKLANVLMAKALAPKLPKGVQVFALHPGVIATGLANNMGFLGSVYMAFAKTIGRLFLKSIPQGTATSIYAATAPELASESGAYLADCRIVAPSRDGSDDSLADRVWALSERAIAQA